MERAKVACYRFERAPHAVALYLPGNFFNTESGSMDEACKKIRAVYCTGLDRSLIYT